MSKLLGSIGRAGFFLGVVAALGFGAQTAVAARRTLQCECVPGQGADEFCVKCCEAPLSLCPPGGTEPRECLCA
jgi:hypothetical protein